MITRPRSSSSSGSAGFVSRAAGLAAVALFGAVLSLATVAPWAPAEAAPRPGFGSRGTRTYQAPPSTTTAPGTAAPIERSMAPRPGQPGAMQPGATAPSAGGLFGGFGRSLLGGLLLGGLVGALLGSGFGGLAGILGLVLQVALIGGAIWLVMRLIRGRQQPSYAGAQPLERGYAPPAGPAPSAGPGLGGAGSGLGGGYGAPGHDPSEQVAGAAPYAPARGGPLDEIGLTGADFDAFERLLGEVETAFGRGDVEELKTLTTPEAHRFLAENLEDNAARGLVNEIRDVRLLQGDLSEAWREGNVDFATVALRFSMIDVTRERAGGRVVEGDAERPVELTQVWTFVRERGFGRSGAWRLSAIQES